MLELRLDELSGHIIHDPYALPSLTLNPHGQSNLEWHRTNEKGHVAENVRRWLSVLEVCLPICVGFLTVAKVSELAGN